MSTAFTRERDAKRAAKEAKKKADKEEKERAQQAKVVEEFNEKQTQANAAGDPCAKLKAWCSKPPYLDLGNEIKVRLSNSRRKTPMFSFLTNSFLLITAHNLHACCHECQLVD